MAITFGIGKSRFENLIIKPVTFVMGFFYGEVNMQYTKELGEEMRLARVKMRLSQRDVANNAGVSHSTICEWERGVAPRGIEKSLNAFEKAIEFLGLNKKQPLPNGLRELEPQPAIQIEISEVCDDSKIKSIGDFFNVDDWEETIEFLPVSKFTKAFCRRLKLSRVDKNLFIFKISAEDSRLLDSDMTEKVKRALSEYFEEQVFVQIIVVRYDEPIEAKTDNFTESVEQSIEAGEALSDEPDFTIPPENEIVTNPKVMLSIEIAALTGKKHFNVIRDIESITEQMQNSKLSFVCEPTTYEGSNGQKYKCYELDYEATMIVMTGYDVVARAKVIKRWQELEKIAKGEAPKFESKPENNLIENIKAAGAVIDATMTMLNRLGIEGNQATLGANKVAAKVTGFNILEEIGAANIVSPVQEIYFTPTQLGKRYGGLSPQSFNTLLCEKGFQEKVGDKWKPTDKGKPFSVIADTDKSSATGTVQQLFWYETVINELK